MLERTPYSRSYKPQREEPAMKFTYASGDRPLEGYTIKHGIGRGGFGEVYYAVSDGGKEVALKLVQRNLEVELRGVGQCLNLKHPNLVALHDIKQAGNGDYWVIMEYVAGETLDQVIAQHPDGLPPEEAGVWLQAIADGVGYLHEQGLVHRDLKPGNIVRGSGLVKIGDYGLSKFMSASRRSGQTGSVGTVHYMAPEVANGRYGKEVDFYAIGILLYEMLSGRVPFDGQSVGEILLKHLTAAPDVSVLPPAYRPVVARLLHKDPYQRYSSVQAMLADLKGYLAFPPELDQGPHAAPPLPRYAHAGRSPGEVGSNGPPGGWEPARTSSAPPTPLASVPSFWYLVTAVAFSVGVGLVVAAQLGLTPSGRSWDNDHAVLIGQQVQALSTSHPGRSWDNDHAVLMGMAMSCLTLGGFLLLFFGVREVRHRPWFWLLRKLLRSSVEAPAAPGRPRGGAPLVRTGPWQPPSSEA